MSVSAGSPTSQLQMVRDRFIDGQADRSLRHLDSLEPNTPMIEMVDSCRIWERHCEPEIRPQMGTDKGPVHMTGQVSEDRPIPAIPSEMESVEETIRRLLPTPAPPPLQAAPKYTDRDILVRQLMETICPPMLVAQERPPMNDLEKRRHSIDSQWEQSRWRTPQRGAFHAENGHIIRSNVRL